jgi:NAD+ synthase (glutamine-hydrolysing)
MIPFTSIYAHGFVRVAAATPYTSPADPAANAAGAQALLAQAQAAGAVLLAFPELSLTGYAIDDLLLQDALLDGAERGLAAVLEASRGSRVVCVVGLPLRWRGAVYNTAAVLQDGKLLGVTPKTFLPNYREFYERRWFASGASVRGETITVAGQEAAFGVDLLFAADDVADFVFGVEICEDMWAPTPPSTAMALAGAHVIVNLSASNITIGKARDRRILADAQSRRTACAYLFSAAGPGESTTDLAWDGDAFIYEAGDLLAEGERFPSAPRLVVGDVDLDRIRQERMRLPTVRDAASLHPPPAFRRIAFRAKPPTQDLSLNRVVSRYPFVPDEARERDALCFEAYSIQVQGLARRLEAARAKSAVIGVSGGLDSTHALIVAARAFDLLGRPRSDILAYTLPGFATGDASKTKAWALMRALRVSAAEIDIRPAAEQMLRDIGHPAGRGEPVYDVAFENVQAGLRTDYLFRLANAHGGLVVGTGDLSELALGWCTYGVGDHMSHYGVNAGVPKTLIQHLIAWAARTGAVERDAGAVLEDILAQDISPELVPPGPDGQAQSTEAAIGPYALHDFFLHHVARFGFRPSKIIFLAEHAWGDAARGAWPDGAPQRDRRSYDRDEIKAWLALFLERFFASQYKRSALPNGPKVTSAGALSPRGDWRAPSDASAAAWLEELRRNVP